MQLARTCSQSSLRLGKSWTSRGALSMPKACTASTNCWCISGVHTTRAFLVCVLSSLSRGGCRPCMRESVRIHVGSRLWDEGSSGREKVHNDIAADCSVSQKACKH